MVKGCAGLYSKWDATSNYVNHLKTEHKALFSKIEKDQNTQISNNRLENYSRSKKFKAGED